MYKKYFSKTNPRNRITPPWSDDLEKALVEQSRIILGSRGGSSSSPQTALLVLLAAAGIAGVALLCFANWQNLLD